MKYLTTPVLVLGILGALALAAPGCGGDSNNSPSGGSAGSGGGGAGGHTVSTGGTGGSADSGAQASSFVNAGGVAKSQNYKMVFTLGQSTPSQGRSSSAGYRMQGGILGATGSFK